MYCFVIGKNAWPILRVTESRFETRFAMLPLAQVKTFTIVPLLYCIFVLIFFTRRLLFPVTKHIADIPFIQNIFIPLNKHYETR